MRTRTLGVVVVVLGVGVVGLLGGRTPGRERTVRGRTVRGRTLAAPFGSGPVAEHEHEHEHEHAEWSKRRAGGPCLARIAPASAPPRRNAERLARLELALGTPLAATWSDGGALEALELLRIDRLTRATPLQASAALLTAVGRELGWVALDDPDAPLPAGACWRPIRASELDGDSALVQVEPLVDGVPIADAGLVVELALGSDGWAPVGVLGRLDPAPRPTGAWGEAGERESLARCAAYEAGSLLSVPRSRRVVERVLDGWRLAWEVEGPGADGVARRVTLDAETGALLAVRPLGCAGTALARIEPADRAPAPADLPLPELTVVQGGASAVTEANGHHPFTETVSVPSFSGPGLRVFRTHRVAGGFAGRIEWDPATDPRWSGPADFTLLAAASEAEQGDAVHAFWNVGAYREHLRRAFPITTAWNRRPGRAPALSQRIALWPDQSGPMGYFQNFPVTIDGEEFPGLIMIGRQGTLSFTRVSLLVRHEYTHCVLQELADIYGSPVDEGLADYFPCAEAEDPHFCRVIGGNFYRDLSGATGKLVWPADAEPSYEIHRVGNILGQALWQARTAAEAQEPGGRLRVDKAVMAAVVRCPPRPDLLLLRAALVAAERDLDLGRFQGAIERACFEHGIGPAPVPTTAPAQRSIQVVNGASYEAAIGLAPGSLASAFGVDLAPGSATAALPLPDELLGTRVTVIDAAGTTRRARLVAVTRGQVNFLVPAETAPGPATVVVEDALGIAARGAAVVRDEAPGLFSADGSGRGTAAGTWLTVEPDGARREAFLVDPIDPAGRVWLSLYGTGFARASRVTAAIGGRPAQVDFAGAQGVDPGLDQLNLVLPDGLGPGRYDVEVVVDGHPANRLRVEVR